MRPDWEAVGGSRGVCQVLLMPAVAAGGNVDEHYSDALPPPRPEPAAELIQAIPDRPLFPMLRMIRRKPRQDLQDAYFTLRDVGRFMVWGADFGAMFFGGMGIPACFVTIVLMREPLIGLLALVVLAAGGALFMGLSWGGLAFGFFAFDTLLYWCAARQQRRAPDEEAPHTDKDDPEDKDNAPDSTFRERPARR